MTVNAPSIAHIDPIEQALSRDADPPIQAMLCGTLARMARAEALLRAQPETSRLLTLHRTEYPDRDLSILDILPAGCSKGAALLSLAATRGIHPGQILAIGDNWNDVSMLEAAGSAVVMANAPEDLKTLAHTRGWAIGPSNLEDGVAEAIESALAVAGMVG
jgi:hydroxymethylpyrimidine pyrophosphatase-like HAD family hydrolase